MRIVSFCAYSSVDAEQSINGLYAALPCGDGLILFSNAKV